MLKTEELKLVSEWDKTFPKSEKVDHEKVTFVNRYGITLAADLYKPKNASGKYPAIAVSGPFGAVKEQCSGLYAQTMAERGYLTIAFDPSFTGESGGYPRFMASPDINTEDFMAAVDFLSVREDVDPDKIGIIGICGWGGMALNAAALDTRIKATVASTMYDMTRVNANGYAIGELLGMPVKYTRIPKFDYLIGSNVLDKNGVFHASEDMTESMLELVLERFYKGEPIQQSEQREDETEEADVLSISVPRNMFTDGKLENLQKLIEGKQTLFKHAFRVEQLEVAITENQVSFPWFPLASEPDAVSAYTEFISKLCELAIKLKRVALKDKEVENEKYAFRCFLLRLGFIGDDSKVARRILLQNLSGNLAFRKV